MSDYTWLLIFIPVGLWWVHTMYLRDKIDELRRWRQNP